MNENVTYKVKYLKIKIDLQPIGSSPNLHILCCVPMIP